MWTDSVLIQTHLLIARPCMKRASIGNVFVGMCAGVLAVIMYVLIVPASFLPHASSRVLCDMDLMIIEESTSALPPYYLYG